mgnify:CR=1 FL=1
MTAVNSRFDPMNVMSFQADTNPAAPARVQRPQAAAEPCRLSPMEEAVLNDHFAKRCERCPDCSYTLDAGTGACCPECGLSLRASMFLGAGRYVEHARQGVGWGVARLPFFAGLWTLGWALFIAWMRLTKPVTAAVGADPFERLSAAGELYGVVLNAILGAAFVFFGVLLWISRSEWQRDRTWRFWGLAAVVVVGVHAPALIPHISGGAVTG